MSLLQRLLEGTRSGGRRRHVFFDYSYLPRERDWSRSPGIQALTRKAYQSADHYKALLANFAGYRTWLEKIPAQAGEADPTPRWINGAPSPPSMPSRSMGCSPCTIPRSTSK